MVQSIIWFKHIGIADIDQVGGKNASLGEMINHLSNKGVRVPNGFAITADAYRAFLQQNQLDTKIQALLKNLDVDDIRALNKVGETIRQWIITTPLPVDLQKAIEQAYQELLTHNTTGSLSVAVRSSATAEDLPDASFAGQQETLLNIKDIKSVIQSVNQVYASLYNDRAIAYRVHQGFGNDKIALSVGIQQMVRSDLGASGVMFTLDTESGFQDVVLITGAWGLGESVVQGAVNPDEFYVYKPALQSNCEVILSRHLGKKAIKMVYSDTPDLADPIKTIEVSEAEQQRFCLSDAQIKSLAQDALLIEEHYQRPMDIEWALDGTDGKLYIVQARPETVESRAIPNVSERYQIAKRSQVLLEGRAIGQRIGAGQAKVIYSSDEMSRVDPGDVLITDMTDPDWEPVMKRAAAIVTNRGGRTCHAAIIARELGIPALVGCHDATEKIKDQQAITVSCAEGDTGFVYEGLLDFKVIKTNTGEMPSLPTQIMMNVGNPRRAFAFAQIPNAGVGLARLEFIINNIIGIHPKALLNLEKQPDAIQKAIRLRTAGYASAIDFYVDKLSEGIATICAAFSPHPVIVRLSDFKSNEYANLIGGQHFEPTEENPMIGFRGTSRYLSDGFADCFALECQAIKKVRHTMGLDNLQLMVPFCRTVDEAKAVVDLLAEHGLKRGEGQLKIIMMCEIPANALLAEEFLQYFDGFSIGSNDMTQLSLGLDRDSSLIAHLFDERNPAVKQLLAMAIRACHQQNKYIGICGQGPSDYPDFAKWLFEQGIDSISLNPDTVIDTWLHLAKTQQESAD